MKYKVLLGISWVIIAVLTGLQFSEMVGKDKLKARFLEKYPPMVTEELQNFGLWSPNSRHVVAYYETPIDESVLGMVVSNNFTIQVNSHSQTGELKSIVICKGQTPFLTVIGKKGNFPSILSFSPTQQPKTLPVTLLDKNADGVWDYLVKGMNGSPEKVQRITLDDGSWQHLTGIKNPIP